STAPSPCPAPTNCQLRPASAIKTSIKSDQYGICTQYNYLGALGAQNWLSLSADPTYGHFELEAAFRQHADEIVTAAQLIGQSVDFISLGPGDGSLDLTMLRAFQRYTTLSHYYPFDLSFELLQRTVSHVLLKSGDSFPKNIRIKAIHGDFTRLITYKPIYSFAPSINFFALIGYSLGNHNEAELLGKIREGMEIGDLLFLDARLYQDGTYTGQKPNKEQIIEITRSYSHGLNNRFAFGPLEAATLAEFSETQFMYDVNTRLTAVPNARNITTYCENIQTKFRRTGTRLSRKRLDLAVTTVYDDASLAEWLPTRGFDLVWHKREKRTAFYLLRKSSD
ncbi:MAG: L-histidine N(alpha)-methyltransferase, partial [Gammaproteobacteria bacterium]